MRNFDEATITDAVLQRVRAAKEFAAMLAGTAVDGRAMTQPYHHLNYEFGLKANSEARRTGERAA